METITETITEKLLLRLPPILSSLLSGKLDNAFEIRLRAGQAVCIRRPDSCENLDLFVSGELLSETLQLLCGYSLYAYCDDIAKGFITVDAFRVGIGGAVIFENGQSRGIRTVSSLNIRIPRQIKGCADNVLSYIKNKNTVLSTLLASPPSCGKTTILRDVARQLSDSGKNVCIIDERGELASLDINGTPTLDIGSCTDVLGGCSKAVGVSMSLRALSPEVIILDEIGSRADAAAIGEALTGGAAVICSVHADSLHALRCKNNIAPLLKDRLFGRVIMLEGLGRTAAVYDKDGDTLWQG